MGYFFRGLELVFDIITKSPQTLFQSGSETGQALSGPYQVVTTIYEVLKSVALPLLLVFFAYGMLSKLVDYREFRKPEAVMKMFIRFVLAKAIVDYGLNLMELLMDLFRSLMNLVWSENLTTLSESFAPPEGLFQNLSVTNLGTDLLFVLPVVILLGVALMVCVLALILTVYGRFFKIYLYTAFSPLPLASFASEQTQSIGKTFLRSYIAVLLEGVVIIIALRIFMAYMQSAPIVAAPAQQAAAETNTLAAQYGYSVHGVQGAMEAGDNLKAVLLYLGKLLFDVLLLLGAIRGVSRVVKEMTSL